MKAVTFSIRLEEDLHELVQSLKEDKALGIVIRVLLKALKHDRATTLAFLLGVSEHSLNNSRILENALRTSQLIDYHKTGSTASFQEYVKDIGFTNVGDFGNGLSISDVDQLVSTFRNDLLKLDETPTSKGNVDLQNLEEIVDICIKKILPNYDLQATVETNKSISKVEPVFTPSVEAEPKQKVTIDEKPSEIEEVVELEKTESLSEVDREVSDSEDELDPLSVLAGLGF